MYGYHPQITLQLVNKRAITVFKKWSRFRRDYYHTCSAAPILTLYKLDQLYGIQMFHAVTSQASELQVLHIFKFIETSFII